MRFRLAALDDIPAMTALYRQFLDANEGPYPDHQDRDVSAQEFAQMAVVQMMSNPQWFCVVGVVGATLDGQRVVGGKPKAMITWVLAQRLLGRPKTFGYCEHLIVDRQFIARGHARKLLQVSARLARERGAAVLECAWKYGSEAGEIWQVLGVRPFLVQGAWIDEAGEPRADEPILPHRESPGYAPAKAAGGSG